MTRSAKPVPALLILSAVPADAAPVIPTLSVLPVTKALLPVLSNLARSPVSDVLLDESPRRFPEVRAAAESESAFCVVAVDQFHVWARVVLSTWACGRKRGCAWNKHGA